MSGPASGRRIDARDLARDAPEWEQVGRHLRGGGLLAYPTETVYGFGCALRDGALERLSELKRRAPDRPFLLLVPSRESVADLLWTEVAADLADAFWPGPLTLILADPEERYPARVRGPSGGVAVRRTPHPVARTLVERLDEPVTSTSANRPGGRPARSAGEASRAARALGAGHELLVVDGGTLSPSAPSTIVDCTDEGRAVVVREGAIASSRLNESAGTGS